MFMVSLGVFLVFGLYAEVLCRLSFFSTNRHMGVSGHRHMGVRGYRHFVVRDLLLF